MIAQLNTITTTENESIVTAEGIGRKEEQAATKKAKAPKPIKRYSYVIKPFMINLGLTGRALNLYALIYAFTNGEHGVFWGSQQHLSDLLNCSKRSLERDLKKLRDMGLIERREGNGKKIGIATTLIAPQAPTNEPNKDYNAIEIKERKYDVVKLGINKMVYVSREQLYHLRTLADEDTLSLYVMRLERIIEERNREKKPMPTGHFSILKKWLNEDFCTGEE